MGSQGGLHGTRPAAAAVLGISPAAELSLLGSQMHTSNRSACHPCSNRVSATSRTAVYGPVRTVVWEGRSCEAPPYPDLWHKADIAAVFGDVCSSGQSRHRASMGGVAVYIPGTAGIVEAKAALMAQAVQHQFNIATTLPAAAPDLLVRNRSAGDLG